VPYLPLGFIYFNSTSYGVTSFCFVLVFFIITVSKICLAFTGYLNIAFVLQNVLCYLP
jgi:hypothetical protein